MLPIELKQMFLEAMPDLTDYDIEVQVDYDPDNSALQAKLKYFHKPDLHKSYEWRSGLAVRFEQWVLANKLVAAACVEKSIRSIDQVIARKIDGNTDFYRGHTR